MFDRVKPGGRECLLVCGPMPRTIIRKASGGKRMEGGVRLCWEGRRSAAALSLEPLTGCGARPPATQGSPGSWRSTLAHADNLILLGHLARGSLAGPLQAQGGLSL